MPDTDAEKLSVETPESVAFAYELAGLGSRGIAFAIDSLILAAIILAEVVVIGGGFLIVYYVVRRNLLVLMGPWVIALAVVVVFLTYWGYFVFGEAARGGRTPGKKALGIRVLRDDGSRVGVADSLIRNFIRIIDSLPGSYAVGVVTVLLSPRQKRLGDIVAGTVVVRDGDAVALLSDGGEDAERIALAREFLERSSTLTPEARYQVAVAVLATFGEGPAGRDEAAVIARLRELALDPGPAAPLTDERPLGYR